MNTSESSRIILGLRAAGWDEKSINDFITWIKYLPSGSGVFLRKRCVLRTFKKI